MEKIEVIGVGVRIAGKECIVTEEELSNMRALLKRANPTKHKVHQDDLDAMTYAVMNADYNRAVRNTKYRAAQQSISAAAGALGGGTMFGSLLGKGGGS